MKIYGFLIILTMILPISAYAVAQDIRISDNDGDVLAISSGAITLNTVNTPGTPSSGVATDIRISDNNERVMSINADGTLNATWQ